MSSSPPSSLAAAVAALTALASAPAAVFVLVGVIWGVTNPLLKRGSVGAASDENASLLALAPRLARRVAYLLPLGANSLGSVLFMKGLGDAQLSIAVPLANGVAFVVSLLVGRALGESEAAAVAPLRMLLGSALVILGVALCASAA